MMIVQNWISERSAMTFTVTIYRNVVQGYCIPFTLNHSFLFEPERAKGRSIWSGQGLFIEEHLRYDHDICSRTILQGYCIPLSIRLYVGGLCVILGQGGDGPDKDFKHTFAMILTL